MGYSFTKLLWIAVLFDLGGVELVANVAELAGGVGEVVGNLASDSSEEGDDDSPSYRIN
jgi:hypothetical protein